MSSISGASSVLYPLLNGVNGTEQPQQSLESQIITSIGQSAKPQTTAVQPQYHQDKQANPLFQQVQQSVTNALQSAQSGGATDPNQLIEQAIASVIQQNSGSSSDTDSTSGTSATSGTSTQQTFLNTLKSYGIDPQQFRSDFLSAIKQAQSGQTDSGTAFSSFPPGLTFDTTG